MADTPLWTAAPSPGAGEGCETVFGQCSTDLVEEVIATQAACALLIPVLVELVLPTNREMVVLHAAFIRRRGARVRTDRDFARARRDVAWAVVVFFAGIAARGLALSVFLRVALFRSLSETGARRYAIAGDLLMYILFFECVAMLCGRVWRPRPVARRCAQVAPLLAAAAAYAIAFAIVIVVSQFLTAAEVLMFVGLYLFYFARAAQWIAAAVAVAYAASQGTIAESIARAGAGDDGDGGGDGASSGDEEAHAIPLMAMHAG